MERDEMADKVLAKIDAEELVALALDLGNIDSPSMAEGEVAQYVYDWLARSGFSPRKVALVPDRPNIVATLPGTGNGVSLLFNGHLDTTIAKEETWVSRRAADPVFHSAWREGDLIYGNGVCNNKGPLASWLVAAKAIRQSGVQLKGDLVLSAVVAEIGLEPVDEFQPPQYTSKEAGARYTLNRGVVADYSLVVEGTDFDWAWVEAGKAFFKISIFGHDLPIYTPYIQGPTPPEKNPNAVVRMARFIGRLEEWAWEYERKNRYECPGGVVVPMDWGRCIRSILPVPRRRKIHRPLNLSPLNPKPPGLNPGPRRVALPIACPPLPDRPAPSQPTTCPHFHKSIKSTTRDPGTRWRNWPGPLPLGGP